MTLHQDLIKIRDGLAAFQPAPAHQANTPPRINEIYAPAGHEAALDPDRPVVVGGRGVGKSFWAGSLLDGDTRKFISSQYPRLKLSECDVFLGFGGVDTIDGGPPSAEVLSDLITKDRFKPEIIWRAVVLHCLRAHIDIKLPTLWRGKKGLVNWANEDSERLQLILRSADQRLVEKKRKVVIVFDALDRLGDDWVRIRDLSKAIMRVALALRSYRAIKPKIFIRIDQAEDPSLIDFPDASKLMGGRVDLVWERFDLYGLLFSHLVNEENTKKPFRKLLKAKFDLSFPPSKQAILPSEFTANEAIQIRIFDILAGEFMGSNPRRGKTYSWVHNHLSDAFGRVSPRSFLEALRTAANNSSQPGRAIDPKGLQAGLQSASSLRVDQLREEFHWIRNALEPLADLRVPCIDQALFDRWQEAKTIEAIKKAAKGTGYLAPVEFDNDDNLLVSLLDAMKRIGVAERRTDGRINVPDIYRVAAKLLKRGGVKPTN
ncbi:hypothetical protein [Undibacterium sp.]|uniref:hypothetical protein n=1 Tax=Undibacterium sp. TaxID=1914977 RepID=UPI002BD92AB9|nr:hypothetical protein [Undibacterium sp.]HTD06780.1 hypothetical protein [Undibacterium sp.]